MRHRLAMLTLAVLTAAGAAGCGSDRDAPAPAPAPPPVGPAGAVPGGSVAPGVSAGASGASGAVPGGPAAAPGGGTNAPGLPGTAGAPARPADAKPRVPGETITAFGIGPYEIGVSQSQLRSAKLIGKVTDKNGCQTGTGSAEFQQPALTFAAGKLQRITVTSRKVGTPEGATIGSSYADLQRLYPSGKELTDWVGARGWLSADGANALLFRLKDDRVTGIVAGEAGPVQFSFTDNQPC